MGAGRIVVALGAALLIAAVWTSTTLSLSGSLAATGGIVLGAGLTCSIPSIFRWLESEPPHHGERR
jgi:hypothetical protein